MLVNLQKLIDLEQVEVGDGYRTKSDQLGVTGIPILRVADVHNGKLLPSYKDLIKEEYLSKINKKLSQQDDVVITTKGTVGRIAQIPKEFPTHAYSPQVCYLRSLDQKVIDSDWLYYWARSREFTRQAEKYLGQTDMAPYISLSDLRSFELELPDIETQLKIVSSIKPLEELLSANERVINQVRYLSQNVFQYLVSFSNEKIQLKDLASISPSRESKPTNTEIFYIQIGDVSDGSVEVPEPMNWLDAPASARLSVIPGDIIWSRVRPNRRSHAYLVDPAPNTIVTTGMTVIRAVNAPSSYLFAATDSIQFSEYLARHADGTTYPTVDDSTFMNAEIPWVGEQRALTFHSIMMPLWELTEKLRLENSRLTRSISTLSPQLFAGHIYVENSSGHL